MSHLPEQVSEEEITEMFSFADKNNDGKIGWDEFMVLIINIHGLIFIKKYSRHKYVIESFSIFKPSLNLFYFISIS